MKIAVVVVVYNRFENIRRWIHAWEQCEQMGANLYLVNNQCFGQDIEYWKTYCDNRGVNFIHRVNIGFGEGVVQELIEKPMIQGGWDILFFCTDDTIPMKKDFLSKYIEEISKPDVGVACMEISSNYTPHIRTTGWCIRREIAEKLTFPASPVTTKEECYHFEHTGGSMTLLGQIFSMELKAIQCSPLAESGVWDTDHNHRFNRWEEWHKEFPEYN